MCLTYCTHPTYCSFAGNPTSKCLETFVVVITGVWCSWHLVGRDVATRPAAHGEPPQWGIIGPEMSGWLRLRHRALKRWCPKEKGQLKTSGEVVSECTSLPLPHPGYISERCVLQKTKHFPHVRDAPQAPLWKPVFWMSPKEIKESRKTFLSFSWTVTAYCS